MITLEESGLAESAYQAVLSGDYPVAQQVLVQRRNLLFEDEFDTGADAGASYDTFQDGKDLYFAYIEGGTLYCKVMDLDLWVWGTASAVATGANGAIAPSFGDERALFYVDDSGDVIRAWSTDGFQTYDNEMSVDRSEKGLDTITHIAGVAYNEVVIAEWRTDYNTRFHIASHASTLHSSFVYWPHKITGMDALRITPPTAHSYASDLVVISSVLPYQMGLRAVGTNVETVALERSGLIAFEARGQNWSDHYIVDQFDDSGAYQYRKQPKLTQIDNDLGSDLVALTAYGVDGDEDYHHGAMRLYFSSTGKEWELEQLLEAEDVYGAMLYRYGDTAVLVSRASMWTSDSTEITGHISDAVQIDITERVLSHSISHSGIRQSSIELSNLMDWVTETLLNYEYTFSVITRLGAHDGTAWRFVPIGHQIVDSISPERNGPSERLRILARDMGSLLTSTRSPHVRENDTQTIGADNFWDDTDTGYGGLRHTAAIQGSWSTANNQLKLSSNNKVGIASMTFSLRVWNGSAEAKVDWATDGNDEWTGLVFRVYDKDNYYRVYYDQSIDKISVSEIRAGEHAWGTNQTSTLGWVRGEDHYIKVVFHYSLLKVYVSDDGANWTQVISVVMEGKEPAQLYVPTAEVPLEMGSVGYFGKGYSAEDNWDWDWDFDNGAIPSPSAPGDSANMGPPGKTYAATFTEIRVTDNLLADTPAWTQVWVPPSGQIRAFLLDLQDPKQKAMVVVSSSDNGETYIYELTNLGSGSPTATIKQTLPYTCSEAKLANTVQWYDTWFLALRANTGDGKDMHVFHTHDRWNTMTSALNVGRCEGNDPVAFAVSSNANSQEDGNVYIAYLNYNGNSQLRRSTDYGHSFANLYQFPSWHHPVGIWVPWLGNEGDQYIYAAWGSRLYRSSNGGSSFTEIDSGNVSRGTYHQQYNPISYTLDPLGLYYTKGQSTTISIHRTPDGGDTIETMGTAQVADGGWVNLGGWPFEPFDTLIINYRNGILVSTDGGATWQNKGWAGGTDYLWTIPLWVP